VLIRKIFLKIGKNCKLFFVWCVQCTNRTLLRWLKLWDHVVFGTELKPPKMIQSQANDAKLKKKDGFTGNKPANGTENELLDDSNRPVLKVRIDSTVGSLLK